MTTDDEGHFSFIDVRPGSYQVTLSWFNQGGIPELPCQDFQIAMPRIFIGTSTAGDWLLHADSAEFVVADGETVQQDIKLRCP
jgi:hypothetical protein